MEDIVLGQEYKDPVTGFKGIAVAATTFLHGCRRIGLQPPVDKDGDIRDSQYFDEPQLVSTKKPPLPKDEKRDRGGPLPYSVPTRPRSPTR